MSLILFVFYIFDNLDFNSKSIENVYALDLKDYGGDSSISSELTDFNESAFYRDNAEQFVVDSKNYSF